MSNIACWNIRGFNMPHKHKEVREFVNKYDLDIVGLLDMRVHENKD